MWGNFYIQFINDSNLVPFVSLKKKKSQHLKDCIQSRLTLLKGCMQSTKIKVKFGWYNTMRWRVTLRVRTTFLVLIPLMCLTELWDPVLWQSRMWNTDSTANVQWLTQAERAFPCVNGLKLALRKPNKRLKSRRYYSLRYFWYTYCK